MPEHHLQTEWIYGGATLWRRKVIEQFQYASGTSAMVSSKMSISAIAFRESLSLGGSGCAGLALATPGPGVEACHSWHSTGRQQDLFYPQDGQLLTLALSWALFWAMYTEHQSIPLAPGGSGLRRFWGNLKGLRVDSRAGQTGTGPTEYWK